MQKPPEDLLVQLEADRLDGEADSAPVPYALDGSQELQIRVEKMLRNPPLIGTDKDRARTVRNRVVDLALADRRTHSQNIGGRRERHGHGRKRCIEQLLPRLVHHREAQSAQLHQRMNKYMRFGFRAGWLALRLGCSSLGFFC